MEDLVRKPPDDFTIEDFDRELIARGIKEFEKEVFAIDDGMENPSRKAIIKNMKGLYDEAKSWPRHELLKELSTDDLIKKIILETEKLGRVGTRGIWVGEGRLDFFEIPIDEVKENAECVAAVCLESGFIHNKRGRSKLRVGNYGEMLKLCHIEPFHEQPAAEGPLCTGFLVKEDVVATAAHFTRSYNAESLRFIFDYKIETSCARAEDIPSENIYKGVEIIGMKLTRGCKQSDWALVRLDRKVVGRKVAVLSKKDIFEEEPIYVMGYPCGLPLKYAPGASVRNVEETYFSAYLDIYSGNSGSPVFDTTTHEVIGMVVHGDTRDFRWTDKGKISVIYPNPAIHSKEPECTRVSEFIQIVETIKEKT